MASYRTLQFKHAVVLGLVAILVVSLISVSTPAYAKIERYKLGMAGPEVKDTKGEIQDYATVGKPVIITSEVLSINSRYVDLPFTLIAEIRDKSGVTVYLNVLARELDSEGYSVTNFLWYPVEVGEYQVGAIAISNLTNPEIMTWHRITEVSVVDQCNQPVCRVLGNDTSYRESYRSVGLAGVGLAKQQSFTGMFTYLEDDKCQSMKLIRCTPYKLDGKSVYTGSDNLDEYLGYVRIRDIALPSFDAVNLDEFLGHRVEIIGKIFRYATVTDGSFEEIIPIRIRVID